MGHGMGRHRDVALCSRKSWSLGFVSLRTIFSTKCGLPGSRSITHEERAPLNLGQWVSSRRGAVAGGYTVRGRDVSPDRVQLASRSRARLDGESGSVVYTYIVVSGSPGGTSVS